MDGFLLFLVLFVVTAIFWLWWRGEQKIYPVTHSLSLEGDQNQLVSYYGSESEPTDLSLLAQQALQDIFSIDVPPARVFLRDGPEPSHPKEQVLDLRRVVGISGELVLLPQSLGYSSNFSSGYQLQQLLYSGQLSEIKSLITQTLQERYEAIRNCPLLTKLDGSYAYLSEKVPLVESLTTPKGERINLLCSQKQFLTLLDRLDSQHLTHPWELL